MTETEALRGLVRKLVAAGIEFTPMDGHPYAGGEVSGYDSHGQVELSWIEVQLLRECLSERPEHA